ncbi:unnamed protein product [Ranitomeya imitator]|uniref:Aconitase/3-isopropylmalate dehydratase large subunit alpha/beta/alpha domain-containing protein n=1 Tax=Ranitomeya imitator TaxID=111125 RepID=A0ABN9LQ79_9NEOB|nr:unnamed protein product [Ranitomeya imitator]
MELGQPSSPAVSDLEQSEQVRAPPQQRLSQQQWQEEQKRKRTHQQHGSTGGHSGSQRSKGSTVVSSSRGIPSMRTVSPQPVHSVKVQSFEFFFTTWIKNNLDMFYRSDQNALETNLPAGRFGGRTAHAPAILEDGGAQERRRTDHGRLDTLPFCIRVVLEAVIRNCDGVLVKQDDAMRVLKWKTNCECQEIPFLPARVVLQDFTGIPAMVDFAAMRDAVKKFDRDPKLVNPVCPTDLIADHSLQLDFTKWYFVFNWIPPHLVAPDVILWRDRRNGTCLHGEGVGTSSKVPLRGAGRY